jgi:hypothetical protein
MPLSKAVELAQAKRQLRRIEEDRAAFQLRLKAMGASPEATEKGLNWFNGVHARAEERVRELEAESG